jgi:hypothetical protein
MGYVYQYYGIVYLFYCLSILLIRLGRVGTTQKVCLRVSLADPLFFTASWLEV